jgi:phenylacetate-CoA ligase
VLTNGLPTRQTRQPDIMLEELYHVLPVTLQNVAVSVYGLRLRRQRRTRHSTQYRRMLDHTARLDTSALARWVSQRARRFVHEALENVPYYRQLNLDANAWRAENVNVAELLRSLPVIDRRDVRSKGIEFRRADVPDQFTLSTSGTTGSPMTIYCDRESRALHYAFFDRLWGSSGIRHGKDWRATFYGRTILSPSQQRAPYWRFDIAQRNVLFSSYHISRASVSAYAAELRRTSPLLVVGYPSSLATLSELALQAGCELPRPKMVMTTAEKLSDRQRSAIQHAFGVPVTDQYGCTEMTHFVSQCPLGSYHIHLEHGLVEILREDGSPCSPGEIGQVVVTGLVNRTMPLLRYRIADTASFSDHMCNCGSAFPVLGSIAGRSDDVLHFASGRTVGRFDPVFKGFTEVLEAQIEQTSPTSLIVRMVASLGYCAEVGQKIVWEIRKRVGDDVSIQVELVDAIQRGPGGKFLAVIGLMKPRADRLT